MIFRCKSFSSFLDALRGVLLAILVLSSILSPFGAAAQVRSSELWDPLPLNATPADMADRAAIFSSHASVTGSTLLLWRADMLRFRSGMTPPSSLGDIPLRGGSLFDHLRPSLIPSPERDILPDADDYRALLTGYALARVHSDISPPTLLSPGVYDTEDGVKTDQTIPHIFGLVPDDRIVLYSRHPAELLGVLTALDEVMEPSLSPWMPLPPVDFIARLFARVGVVDSSKLLSSASEVLLTIGDPGDPFGGDDILLVKAKEGMTIPLDLIKEESTNTTIDGYLVLGTDKDVLQRAEHKEFSSLSGRPRAVMDIAALLDHGDSVIYIPDSAVKKWTSREGDFLLCAGEIAARRLEALQYAVLSYRALTGHFPDTIERLFNESFLDRVHIDAIDPGFAKFLERTSVGLDGVVWNADFGSLYAPHPPESMDSFSSDPLFVSVLPSLLHGGSREESLSLLRRAGVSFKAQVPAQVYISLPSLPKASWNPSSIATGDNVQLGESDLPSGEYGLTLVGSFSLRDFILHSPLMEDMRSEMKINVSDNPDERTLSRVFNGYLTLGFSGLMAPSPVDPYMIVGDRVFFTLPKEVVYEESLSRLGWLGGITSSDPLSVGKYLAYLYEGNMTRYNPGSFSGRPEPQTSADVHTIEIPFPFMHFYAVMAGQRAYLTPDGQTSAKLATALRGGQASPVLPEKIRTLLSSVEGKGILLALYDPSAIKSYLRDLLSVPNGFWAQAAYDRLRADVAYVGDARAIAHVLGDPSRAERFFPFVPARSLTLPISVNAHELRLGDYGYSDELRTAPTEGTLLSNSVREKLLADMFRSSGAILVSRANDHGGLAAYVALSSGATPKKARSLVLASSSEDHGSRGLFSPGTTAIVALSILAFFVLYALRHRRMKERTIAEKLAGILDGEDDGQQSGSSQ